MAAFTDAFVEELGVGFGVGVGVGVGATTSATWLNFAVITGAEKPKFFARK